MAISVVIEFCFITRPITNGPIQPIAFRGPVLVSVIYLLKQNLIVGSLFTIGAFLMILPQFIFKRKLKESGELLSSSKEKNLRAITDFGKGIETIICNQAEKENVRQTLVTLGEMEKTQFKYYTLQNLL